MIFFYGNSKVALAGAFFFFRIKRESSLFSEPMLKSQRQLHPHFLVCSTENQNTVGRSGLAKPRDKGGGCGTAHAILRLTCTVLLANATNSSAG